MIDRIEAQTGKSVAAYFKAHPNELVKSFDYNEEKLKGDGPRHFLEYKESVELANGNKEIVEEYDLEFRHGRIQSELDIDELNSDFKKEKPIRRSKHNEKWKQKDIER